ncbi:MAG: LysE family translocator [candidate division Zixibacteria bacterium]|nr:LysE family translocator [candidate division Zixibacteria bacterium]
MIDQSVIAFTIAALVLTLTPGNDTVLVFRNTIAGDKASGFATLLGVCSGLIVHGTLAALGISVILTQSAALFQVVKLVGAGYLIFLGGQSLWSAWNNRNKDIVETLANKTGNRKGISKSYGQGLLTNVLNPKVALFYLSFLPQFVSSTDPLFKPLFLAGIHVLLGIIWLSVVILMIERLRKVLASPKAKSIMDAICGTMLVGLGVRLAVKN